MLHALLILQLSFFWSAGEALLHKFYVSNTIVEFNPRAQTFELTVKIFTDDLEKALDHIHTTKVDLASTSDRATNDLLIDGYIAKHLKFTINDQPVMLRYVGFESEVDLTYCYFEMTSHTDFHIMKVENDLLMEVYPEQKNIVDIRKDGFTRTLILVKGRSVETIVK